MATAFDQVFALVLGHEGRLSMTRGDAGNWTGGKVGVGELRGSKYGISAAAYPTLDIAGLTLAQARTIAWADYWLAARCDLLPAMLALLVFDAAYNNGAGRAVRWLQAAVGATADGLFGTRTAARVATATGTPDGLRAVCARFLDERLWFMAGLKTWPDNRGWSTRLTLLPFQAAALAAWAAGPATIPTPPPIGATQAAA